MEGIYSSPANFVRVRGEPPIVGESYGGTRIVHHDGWAHSVGGSTRGNLHHGGGDTPPLLVLPLEGGSVFPLPTYPPPGNPTGSHYRMNILLIHLVENHGKGEGFVEYLPLIPPHREVGRNEGIQTDQFVYTLPRGFLQGEYLPVLILPEVGEILPGVVLGEVFSCYSGGAG